MRTANLPMEPEKRKLQKFSSPLPNDPDLLAIVNGKALFEVWNAKTRTIAVGVEGNTLVYLAFAVQPKAMRRETFLKHLTDVRKILENGRSSTEGKDEQNDLSSVATKPVRINNGVGLVKQRAVLWLLNSQRDQINSRQVCASWNAILKSRPVLSQVQIDLRDGRAQELVAAMEKLISASTKTLVMRRAGFTRAGFSGPFSHLPCRVVMTLLKARKIKLPTVIVADLNDLRFFHPTALRFGWEEICDRLVMENITLSLSFETRNYRDEGDLLRPETGTHCVWETRAKDVCIKLRVDHAVVAMKAECRMETVLQWLEEAEKIPAAKTTIEDRGAPLVRTSKSPYRGHCRWIMGNITGQCVTVWWKYLTTGKWEIQDAVLVCMPMIIIDFATLDLQSLNKLTIYALFHFFGAEINTW
ncbi:uncharacterized protein LOC129591967 isoform X2 [Paramacrobiotus metropolitanus]|uniref:uncharacterized protein LOC129591967 isoform X2 n=1 Tax=Paramacrobiotus metropolitanus TaxID=2943436 RepID=UPI0024461F7E|nr:uncharacterized protein LOC129591967 isoform X2 [Paramacrobiotus metropolitanus]